MNDPRITAYALGELSGSERKQFERELAASETLQRELNETIKLADMLGKLPMPTETLTPEKRSALREQCTQNLKIARQRIVRRRILAAASLGALAACLLLAPWSPLAFRTTPQIATPDFEGADSRVLPPPSATPPARVVRVDVPPAEQPVAEGSEKYAQFRSQVDAKIKSEMDKLSFNSSLATANAPAAAMSAATATAPAPMVMSAPASTAPAASVGLIAEQTATISAFSGGWGKGKGSGAGGVSHRESVAMRKQLLVADAGWDRPVRRFNFGALDFNTEAYDAIQENVFLTAQDNPLSTFSIDVDTASYANVRRFLQGDQLPPAGAVRTEELINYFSYAYPQPQGDAPFSVNLEVSRPPWAAKCELVRIGLKGREIPASERGPANLVFLVDVSGSMDSPDKLPLLKRSLQSLVENLSPRDRVAIVVYAGSSGLVLPSTPGTEKSRILEALENLQAGGSTNGASGIQLAYNIARENFLKEGNNRVILCTDGDFNVGTTSQSELVSLIEKERASGVFLSVLGFGTGNLKDSTMEKLADKGNGNYAYIDSLTEGRKVLVEQMGATLFTIAKDVKIQVEFNPARVAGYRLIGYENRLLAKEDFNDDKKDAGEIGAGHAVTALYEIIPAGQPLPDQPSVDPLKYQPVAPVTTTATSRASTELLTVKLRYKAPDGDKSQLLEVPLAAPEIPAFEQASPDFRFAAAVAAFGMKLRGSPAAGNIGWSDIQKIVRETLGDDPGSYRAEFLTLIEKAARLKPSARTQEE